MPPKVCGQPGCGNVQPCSVHKVQARKRRDPFYVSPQWTAHRKAFLQANPRCAECGAKSVVADHRHRRPRGAAFAPDGWDSFANLQALCKSCDGSKSAKYDGHFGNPVRSAP